MFNLSIIAGTGYANDRIIYVVTCPDGKTVTGDSGSLSYVYDRLNEIIAGYKARRTPYSTAWETVKF